MDRLPGWADAVLVPLVSLFLAALLSALVILGIGESPVEALRIMITGAFGSTYGWGYTLYYATTFMFTGLAFAVASHAGMFNIGAEGQFIAGAICGSALPILMPEANGIWVLPTMLIMAMLGGMIGPMTELTAVRAAA